MDDRNIEPAALSRFIIVLWRHLLNARRCDGQVRAQVDPAEPLSIARGTRCVIAATGGIEGEHE